MEECKYCGETFEDPVPLGEHYRYEHTEEQRKELKEDLQEAIEKEDKGRIFVEDLMLRSLPE